MSNLFFYEPSHNFDRLIEDIFSPYVGGFVQHSNNNRTLRPFKPRMDLHEDSEKNITTATFELPGINRENVQLDVQNGLLTITSENKTSTESEENGYTVRERQFGKFSRTLRLPQGIKDEDIKAAMADGLLTITFPKSLPERAPKRVTIA